jgi:hypothetical protein
MEIMFSIPADASEPWRVVRLAELWRNFIEKVPKKTARRIKCPHGVTGAIVRLHDRNNSLTVLWYCERTASILGPIMDECWTGLGQVTATHVALCEGKRVKGSDETWRSWIAPCEGVLYDMPPASFMIN